MRTIVAGSRWVSAVQTYEAIAAAPWHLPWGGPDRAGEVWAREDDVTVEQYPADWGHYGHGAVYIFSPSQGEARRDAPGGKYAERFEKRRCAMCERRAPYFGGQ